MDAGLNGYAACVKVVAAQINAGAMATMTPSVFVSLLIFAAPLGDSSVLFDPEVVTAMNSLKSRSRIQESDYFPE